MVDLDIDGIAGGGDGVGRDGEGRVVFVPLTAPGDRVRAEVVKSKPRWASARLSSLLVAAPDRRQPPCPDFGSCGGCRLQHLPEASQAAAKRTIVEEALRRIGGVHCTVPSPIQAGEPLGYRNRITLSASDGRIGFRSLYDPNAIAEIDECLLAEPAVRSTARRLSGNGGLPTGGDLRVTIRASEQGATALFVEGGTRPGSPETVVADLEELVSYWWHDSAGEAHLLAGDETFGEIWQGIHYDLPPTVFLQSNRAVSRAMDTWLDHRIGKLAGLRIVDLYSGVGARAIRWAQDGAEVSACEVDSPAVEAAESAAGRVGVRVDFRCNRVENESGLLAGADVVIVNPPRTGLTSAVRSSLNLASAPLMAYISCDPATLARDLKDVNGTYEVLEVQPFDAFPQTAHIETIAWLRARTSEVGSES